jgi:hypothetical protein
LQTLLRDLGATDRDIFVARRLSGLGNGAGDTVGAKDFSTMR